MKNFLFRIYISLSIVLDIKEEEKKTTLQTLSYYTILFLLGKSKKEAQQTKWKIN